MSALILLIVFGLGMAYFATQNTGIVHMRVGAFLFSGIPIYALVIISMLLGIFVSWLVSLVHTISHTVTLYGKDAALHNSQKTIDQLKEENQTLQFENARLKGERHERITEEAPEAHEEVTPQYKPSFFSRLRQSF